MELSRLLAVITPTIDADVLRVLALADADFTSGDIHRLLDGPSIRGIHNTLGRLTGQGIVSRRPAGRASLYGLNREHLAAPYVIGLARLRDELLKRMGSEVRSWAAPPVLGVLFGSGARRNHTAESDIDLLLVRPSDLPDDVWDDQTESLSDQVAAWTGNAAASSPSPSRTSRSAEPTNPSSWMPLTKGSPFTATCEGWHRRSRATPSAAGEPGARQRDASYSQVHARDRERSTSQGGGIP